MNEALIIIPILGVIGICVVVYLHKSKPKKLLQTPMERKIVVNTSIKKPTEEDVFFNDWGHESFCGIMNLGTTCNCRARK